MTDSSSWSYNRHVPDARKTKELLFLLESQFNPASGQFLIDDLELIDTDVSGPPVSTNSSDSDVLRYFLDTNFNYFRHAVHPETGQVLDRLAFSDLATVAGTGFGLSAWCMAGEIGLMTKDETFLYARRALKTLVEKPMGFTSQINQRRICI